MSEITDLIQKHGLRVVEHRKHPYPQPFDGFIFESFVLSGLVSDRESLLSDISNLERVESAHLRRIKGLPYIEDYDRIDTVSRALNSTPTQPTQERI